jgi:hypothetical protein
MLTRKISVEARLGLTIPDGGDPVAKHGVIPLTDQCERRFPAAVFPTGGVTDMQMLEAKSRVGPAALSRAVPGGAAESERICTHNGGNLGNMG